MNILTQSPISTKPMNFKSFGHGAGRNGRGSIHEDHLEQEESQQTGDAPARLTEIHSAQNAKLTEGSMA